MYRELKKQINYNPDTGKFTWAWPRPGASLGMEAGTVTGNGYLEDAKKAYETKATELFGEFKWSPP